MEAIKDLKKGRKDEERAKKVCACCCCLSTEQKVVWFVRCCFCLAEWRRRFDTLCKIIITL